LLIAEPENLFEDILGRRASERRGRLSGNRNSESEKQGKAEKGLSHGDSPFLTPEAGPTGAAVSVRLVAEARVPI